VAKLAGELTKTIEDMAQSGAPMDIAVLSKLADQVAKTFKVRVDEVALLALTENRKFLVFLVPEKLQNIGNIPMTSTTSLAVRTAREKRPEVINNFTSVRHASVFEAVPLSDERSQPIQKIMSAPIVADGHVLGVIQVSRKGKSLAAAGPDFSPKDLSELVAAGSALGPGIKTYQVPGT